jgi:hypothetical protein
MGICSYVGFATSFFIQFIYTAWWLWCVVGAVVKKKTAYDKTASMLKCFSSTLYLR